MYTIAKTFEKSKGKQNRNALPVENRVRTIYLSITFLSHSRTFSQHKAMDIALTFSFTNLSGCVLYSQHTHKRPSAEEIYDMFPNCIDETVIIFSVTSQ